MGEIADAVRSVAETVDTYGLRTTILAILLLGLACFVAWFAVRSADGAAKSAPRAVASVIVVIAAMVLGTELPCKEGMDTRPAGVPRVVRA
jgi:tetrahydromethanopterin S-methyltransferase subunit C